MQINDTTTLIFGGEVFGGSSSNQAIVTYDWKNSQFTTHTPGIITMVLLVFLNRWAVELFIGPPKCFYFV